MLRPRPASLIELAYRSWLSVDLVAVAVPGRAVAARGLPHGETS
jgi:hypothetical protein